MDAMVEFFGSKQAAKARSEELQKRWDTAYLGPMKAGDDFIVRKWTNPSTVQELIAPMVISGEVWLGVFIEKEDL